MSAVVLRTWLRSQVTGISLLKCNITARCKYSSNHRPWQYLRVQWTERFPTVVAAMYHFTPGTKSRVQHIVYIIFGCNFQKAERSNKASWRLKGKRVVRVQTGAPLKDEEMKKGRYVYNISLGCTKTAESVWHPHNKTS